MTPLVREEVQELDELLRVIGPLSEQELRHLVGVLALVAAHPSPFELAVLTVRIGDGRPDVTVVVGGDGEGNDEADEPVVISPVCRWGAFTAARDHDRP